MSITTTSEKLILNEDLEGAWDYSCKIMLPLRYFPNEILRNDATKCANNHGGEVVFSIIEKGDKSIIEFEGKRTWRKLIDFDTGAVVDHELLETPLKWGKVNFSLLYPDYQLLYQYDIVDNPRINGITNVHLDPFNNEGKTILKGWFYYVPSDLTLLTQGAKMDPVQKMNSVKEANEWLSLFGEVILTKKG